MIRTGATPLRLAGTPSERPYPENRLAELVAHLTGCGPLAAVDAVGRALPPGGGPLSLDENLAVVARALVTVKRTQVDLRSRRPA